MNLVFQSMEEYNEKWEHGSGPLMHEVLDPAYEKLGHEAVNKVMDELAKKLSEFFKEDIRWINIKDCSSWQYSDYGRSHFAWRRPRQK